MIQRLDQLNESYDVIVGGSGAAGLSAALFADGGQDAAFWAPVSMHQRPDGSTAVFPHFVLDRAKPGTLCVDGRGDRFPNESASYHRFARAMIDATRDEGRAPFHILADAAALARYGLGMVRMGGTDPRPGITIGPAITFAYRAMRHALAAPEALAG